jgi:hypothetical protein
MLLRDEEGRIIFSACCYLPRCAEAVEAELCACRDGLELALARSDRHIIIKSNCAQVIAAVKELTPGRSPYMNIIADIKFLASQDRVCNFVKVDRSEVKVSHCLANFARAEHRTEFWLGSSPDVVIQELDRELVVALSS